MTMKDHCAGLLLFEHRSFLKAQTSSVAWLPFWVLLEKLLRIRENLRKKNPNGFCVVFVTSVRWEFREVSLLCLGWNFCTIWLRDEAIKFRKERSGGKRHTYRNPENTPSPLITNPGGSTPKIGGLWSVLRRVSAVTTVEHESEGQTRDREQWPLIFQSTRGI